MMNLANRTELNRASGASWPCVWSDPPSAFLPHAFLAFLLLLPLPLGARATSTFHIR